MPRNLLPAAGRALPLCLGLALASGCERDAEPLLCGDLGDGDLVLTEVRGGPSITDADGQWVELYNGTGAPVDLHGVAITIESVSGQDSDRLLVRRPQTVAAGDYAVLGKFDDPARPTHVDYGWGSTVTVPREGAITLACGPTTIDRITYSSLPDPSQVEDAPPDDPPGPGKGTWALGVMPPSAAANDDAASWCIDATETHGPCGGQTCLDYYKGSPGAANPGCTP